MVFGIHPDLAIAGILLLLALTALVMGIFGKDLKAVKKHYGFSLLFVILFMAFIMLEQVAYLIGLG